MSKQKLNLLEKRYSEDNSPEAGDNIVIEELRVQARLLREENNRIVKQIWDIEHELAVAGIHEDKRRELNQKKDALQDEINDKQLIPKLHALLDEIQRLEIEIFGQSKVNSDSPYKL